MFNRCYKRFLPQGLCTNFLHFVEIVFRAFVYNTAVVNYVTMFLFTHCRPFMLVFTYLLLTHSQMHKGHTLSFGLMLGTFLEQAFKKNEPSVAKTTCARVRGGAGHWPPPLVRQLTLDLLII